ncbi:MULTISPECIES: LysM peptidoglycan-binding domain-containing protein [Paenibacillus]|uniref:Stage VI sporulation protein D n=1 Tax=Paenibacillus pabuli TaxID=1472 RepID=A0A855Y3A4_9BACL|nr:MULTISPECIES: LysM peptidoglycan-binding domain-containing protein [Paenibacillus]PWW35448.1 stage VI sporulation protein D [Paenibacillus pabuli]PXW02885.1 stage VI sporulation protein D [Paenibacillus taichungensis]
MLNQPYGLRFDIYERVHLSEGVPAIEELEEIELYPRIQVIGQDDHATLRGHLLLTGAYRGENEISEELKHFIPVEITVPLNRVRSLEDISIEIENFDVDLLSDRSLNITGVLSLRGIEGFPVEEPQVWSADEFTVVHSPDPRQGDRSSDTEQTGSSPNVFAQEYLLQRSEEELQREHLFQVSPEPSQSWQQGDGNAEQSKIVAENEESSSLRDKEDEAQAEELSNTPSPVSSFLAETADRLASYPESEPLLPLAEESSVWSEPSVETLHTNLRNSEQADSNRDAQPSDEQAAPDVWNFESARSEPKQEDQTVADVPAGAQSENWQDVFAASEPEISEENTPPLEAVETNEPAEKESFIPEPVAETEDKPELKVAFGSKRETAPKQEEGVGISSLLSSGRVTREAEAEREQEALAGVQQQEAYPPDDVEWKNLFLGTIVDQTPFRKVKLCIVQREETLDTIADRYQLSTRELQLYNRLSEQVVEEGQILYIP